MSDILVKKPKKGGVWDVIIIGSGPAAFTAAIYTTRGAASTLLLAGDLWGGQLMNTSMVDNFPGFPLGILGPELMQKMRSQAERFGTEVIEERVTKVSLGKPIKEIYTSREKFLSRAVIIATGALTKWLDVPGEKELIGRGISTCAPCDAPFFKDKKVAVVGGGDTAMEEAQVLTKYASEVSIIHRRDSFKATEAMQKKVLSNPKIKIIWNTEVIKVSGKNKLEKLTVKDVTSGIEKDLVFDGLFVAIGHKPDSDIFKDVLGMDKSGYIYNTYQDYHSATNIKGVFVAGDVMDKQYKQAITSAGTGCAAGMDSLTFLDQNDN